MAGPRRETRAVDILNEAFLIGLFANATELNEAMKLMGKKLAQNLINVTLIAVLDAEINHGTITTAQQLEARITELTK